MTIIYILLAVLIFGVLVIVHEAGHFAAAKACGVRVEEFSVGMGPLIFKKQRGETQYSLRCIPFGGFCAMTGENEASDDPRAFVNQKVWKKLLILVAGSFMNFVLGLLIIGILYSNAEAFYSTRIDSFAENCPYEGEAAFMVGDEVWSIDGQRLYQFADFSEFLDNEDGIYDIVIKRDGRKIKLEDFELVPVEYTDEGRTRLGLNFGYDMGTLGNKLKHTWNTSMEFARLVWMGLGDLFNGNATVNDMAGPVGIVSMMAEEGEAAETTGDALYTIFNFGAFLAINLAVMNMLPIPALDGGRVFLTLVSLIIEAITRRKLDTKYEAYINGAGMILLLALMAYIMFHDIIRIITT